MQLYGVPPTRAVRPIWVLNELGLECELLPLDPVDAADRASIKRVNPSGKVPVLVDDDLTLSESMAIMLYLADRYGQGRLTPESVRARAQVARWNYFIVSEIEQPLWRMALHTAIYDEGDRSPAEIARAKRDAANELAHVEEHLRGRDLFVGTDLTIADFNAAYVLDWAAADGMLDDKPECRRFVETMYARPTAPPRIDEAFSLLRAGRVSPRYRRDL